MIGSGIKKHSMPDNILTPRPHILPLTSMPTNPRKPAIALAKNTVRYVLIFVVLLGTSTTTVADDSFLDKDLSNRCLRVLRSALVGDEFWPAMHAAEALTVAGHTAEVQTALTPRLLREQDDRCRCGLARELVRSGDRSKTVEILAVLAKPESYGHTHAAESLYKVGEVGDGQLLRKAMATESNVPLRIMAAAALARQGNRDAAQFLRCQLSADGREPKQLAVWALARLGNLSDIPALRSILRTDADAVTRGNAAAALAMLGDEVGRKALAGDLDHSDPEIRSNAAEIAGHCRATNLASHLARLLDDPNLDVRVRAAGALLEISQGQRACRGDDQHAPSKSLPRLAPIRISFQPCRRVARSSHRTCGTIWQSSWQDANPD